MRELENLARYSQATGRGQGSFALEGLPRRARERVAAEDNEEPFFGDHTGSKRLGQRIAERLDDARVATAVVAHVDNSPRDGIGCSQRAYLGDERCHRENGRVLAAVVLDVEGARRLQIFEPIKALRGAAVEGSIGARLVRQREERGRNLTVRAHEATDANWVILRAAKRRREHQQVRMWP